MMISSAATLSPSEKTALRQKAVARIEILTNVINTAGDADYLLTKIGREQEVARVLRFLPELRAALSEYFLTDEALDLARMPELAPYVAQADR